MEERKVITLEEWKKNSEQIVAISGFQAGETIYVRLKKVSVLGLASKGKIPNTLMGQVMKMFGNGQSNAPKSADMDIVEMAKLLDIVCAEAMVEPRYEDVKDYLSDEQKNDIMNWTQTGVEALESFREEPRSDGPASYLQTV